MSYTIFTDTSANLPTPLTEKLGLRVLPFKFYLNGEEQDCLDTEAFDGAAFYDAIRNGAEVTTSQINVGTFVDSFESVLREGQDVIFVGMSSGISGSFNSAEVAAAQLREKYPERTIRTIDTLGASLGEGLIAVRGAELRDQGLTVDEAADRLLEMRESMYQVFTVDNLMHLRKTGRLSNASAVVGTVLNIKPLLKGNENGQIVSFMKLRGRKKALNAMGDKYDELVRNAADQVIGIAHADCQEDADYLISLLKKNNPPKDILTVCYEPVTGSHVGPGTLALFFLSDPGCRFK